MALQAQIEAKTTLTVQTRRQVWSRKSLGSLSPRPRPAVAS
jgi:hypothetical protein